MARLALIILLFMNLSQSFTRIPSSPLSIDAVNRRQETLLKLDNSLGLMPGSPVFLRIFKEPKELEVWIKKDQQYVLFKIYTICYYSGTLGTKTRVGDNQAPEGFYVILPSSMNPASNYHLAFNIGYPNAYEKAKKYTGSEIMVHGDCVSIGCYAMGNENIEEIWTIMVKAFEKGQDVINLQIFPFRMTDQNLQSHPQSTFHDFWLNLKEGYEYFENHKTPPLVMVEKGRYCFK